MAILAQTGFEAGTNGATLTTGTSGFDAVTVDTNQLVFSNTQAAHGGLSMSATDTTNMVYGSWNAARLGTLTEHYGRAYIWFAAPGATSKRIIKGLDSGGVQSFAIGIGSGAGKLIIRDAANTVVYTAATAPTFSGWVRVEWHVVNAGAAGTVQVRMFNTPDGTTPTTDSGAVTASTGANVQQAQFGMLDTTGIPIYFDDIAIGDAAGSWLGPAVPSNFTGTLALTGSGALSLTGVVNGQAGGTLNLTGTGTLTVAGKPATTGALALNATGGLVVNATTPIDVWRATTPYYVAHRGGGGDWPEETIYGYAQAARWNTAMALEVSAWQTSDGVWVASHDQTTGRVFNANYDIPTTPWATLATMTSLAAPAQPMARLTDVLDAFPGKVIFVEKKQAGNLTGLLDLLDTYAGGKGRFVLKSYAQSTATQTGAAGRGYQQWGYFFATDTSTAVDTYSPGWSFLGMEYGASTALWSQVLSKGRQVIGHVIASPAQAATAFGQGASGLMVSTVTEVVPQTPATLALAGSGVLTVTGGAAGYSGTANLTGAGSLALSGVADIPPTPPVNITVTATLEPRRWAGTL